MLKLLVKKQIAEVFKGYFYDAKKNKMRSKGAIAAYIIFFILLMVGFLGGTFTFVAISMCAGLTAAGFGWLYFLLMGGIAILLGAFGSVFNSYAGLYLSKDNDLLLSLPIPVKTIMAARLVNVYLLDAMYASVVFVPTLIVYWVTAGATFSRIVCGILLFVIITGIVLVLSCLLGWVIAKLSLKFKNKSFLTVLASLLFIGGYYVVYFRANVFIREIVANAGAYGEKIKGSAYVFYLFGRVGEGDWLAAAAYLAVTVTLFALVWRVLHRSFLQIAGSGEGAAKVRYKEKAVREKSAFGALLGKELGRFKSSPSYMLNCGMGLLFLPICGVLLLIKGQMVTEVLSEAFSKYPDVAAILLCTALCTMTTMNDMAAPSVSLEGKSLWIPQSLPVAPKQVLRAKAGMQLLLSGIPMVFAVICMAVILKTSAAVRLLVIAMPLVYTAFSAVLETVIGLRMPVLNWTNEVAPIKQSGAVTISLFGGWGIWVVFFGAYMLFGHKLGAAPYLAVWTVLFAVLGLALLKWMDTKGSEIFAEL